MNVPYLEGLSKEFDSLSNRLERGIPIPLEERHDDELDVLIHLVLQNVKNGTAMVGRIA